MSPVRTPMSSSTKSGGSGLSPRITEANLARNNNNQSSNLSEDTNKYGPFSRYVFILTMEMHDNNNKQRITEKKIKHKRGDTTLKVLQIDFISQKNAHNSKLE